MKFIHISDLHIGKRMHEFSLLEDQEYILTKILRIIAEEKPDGVLIAGDIYDKSIPSAEAVQLFDNFLVNLSKLNLTVFIISGNHDSPERLAFCNRLINLSGIYISPVYNGTVQPISMSDQYGQLNVYMLPFIKPAHVKRFFPDQEINSYTDAMDLVIKNMQIDTSQRNILITHQFVTGATRSDSEDISVGGSDNVDLCVFNDFDYVALGHIHGQQNIGSEKVRYCGTPLKYSFSEANHTKAVTVVELKEKDNLHIRTIPLIPKRDLVEIKGSYNQITYKGFYENTSYTEDYMHIILTDENDIPEAMSKLRSIYHNLAVLSYDNTRTRNCVRLDKSENIEHKSPLDLFAEFYEKQNGIAMTDTQNDYIKSLISKIWEENL